MSPRLSKTVEEGPRAASSIVVAHWPITAVSIADKRGDARLDPKAGSAKSKMAFTSSVQTCALLPSPPLSLVLVVEMPNARISSRDCCLVSLLSLLSLLFLRKQHLADNEDVSRVSGNVSCETLQVFPLPLSIRREKSCRPSFVFLEAAVAVEGAEGRAASLVNAQLSL